MLFGAILTIFISCIGLFGLSVLSQGKKNKRNRYKKSTGSIGKGCSNNSLERFFKACVYFAGHSNTSCMAGDKQMAGKLSLSHFT